MVTTSSLAAALHVDPALVADVVTAAGRAGYPVDELADSRLARAVIVENTRAGGSWSDAVLAGYRARGVRGSADDGRTVRVACGTEASLVQYRGRPVGRVIEHRHHATFARLDDPDVAASIVLGRLTAHVRGGLVIELVADNEGDEVRPGVPS